MGLEPENSVYSVASAVGWKRSATGVYHMFVQLLIPQSILFSEKQP